MQHILVLLCLVTCANQAAADLRIGVLAAPRGGETFALEGGILAPILRGYIEADFPNAVWVGTQELTSSFVDSVDIMILMSPATFTKSVIPLTLTEQNALTDFVLSGKGVAIVADGFGPVSANSFIAPFGMSVDRTVPMFGSDSTIIDPMTNSIANGPFGYISTYQTNTQSVTGVFTNTGPYANILGRLNATGDASLVYIPENGIQPGSGRVVVVSDGDIFLSSILNNDGLLSNTINYIAVQTVPELSSFATMIAGALILGFIHLIRTHRAGTL